MAKIMIRKNNGKLVPFDDAKVRASLLRTSADKAVVSEVLKRVKKQLRPKITTDEIYDHVREILKEVDPISGARYRLRSSLLRLGPAGFNFEKYVASILTAYGYKTELPTELQGVCVTHEVDVIAEKDGRRMFIEAKFRNNFDDVVNIKDTMSTWARFLDLVEASKLGLCPHFDEAWIVTNARFTKHSLQYGHCKNMVMIGWNHPRERTFAEMVDVSALYPVTVLEDLEQHEINALLDNHISLCRELVKQDASVFAKSAGFTVKRIKELQKQCRAVIKT